MLPGSLTAAFIASNWDIVLKIPGWAKAPVFRGTSFFGVYWSPIHATVK